MRRNVEGTVDDTIVQDGERIFHVLCDDSDQRWMAFHGDSNWWFAYPAVIVVRPKLENSARVAAPKLCGAIAPIFG
jgi:hypothetical protein